MVRYWQKHIQQSGKNVALDRMKALEITNQYFDKKNGEATAERFRHCFGITCPDGEKPQEVMLSFDPFQGRYIKSLPLHHSQQILIDNEDELRVKLKVFITEDFIMELLSYGDKMKVVSPQTLRFIIVVYFFQSYRKQRQDWFLS